MSSSLILDFLHQTGGTAIIDGGLATELERHGADLNDPLWSAKCLISTPQSNLIRQVLTLPSLPLHYFNFLG
jgi:homocysteine S-methyltransferase